MWVILFHLAMLPLYLVLAGIVLGCVYSMLAGTIRKLLVG